jgi:hypothetical protein
VQNGQRGVEVVVCYKVRRVSPSEAHVHSTTLSRVFLSRLLDTSQQCHHRPLAEMYVVRVAVVYSLLIVQPGLKEENSSPTRNAYKVRSFQNAIATIYEHEKPIRSGKEASKVRLCVVSSPRRLWSHHPCSYEVLALALPIE